MVWYGEILKFSNERPREPDSISEMKTPKTTNELAADGGRAPRLVRQGWRFFHCEDCEHRWKESTRDWRSPSGECCPRCNECWSPYHGESDESLAVDRMGNLVPNAGLSHGDESAR